MTAAERRRLLRATQRAYRAVMPALAPSSVGQCEVVACCAAAAAAVLKLPATVRSAHVLVVRF